MLSADQLFQSGPKGGRGSPQEGRSRENSRAGELAGSKTMGFPCLSNPRASKSQTTGNRESLSKFFFAKFPKLGVVIELRRFWDD